MKTCMFRYACAVVPPVRPGKNKNGYSQSLHIGIGCFCFPFFERSFMPGVLPSDAGNIADAAETGRFAAEPGSCAGTIVKKGRRTYGTGIAGFFVAVSWRVL